MDRATRQPGDPATGRPWLFVVQHTGIDHSVLRAVSILGARPSFNFLQHVVPEAERHAPLCGGHPNPSVSSTDQRKHAGRLDVRHTSADTHFVTMDTTNTSAHKRPGRTPVSLPFHPGGISRVATGVSFLCVCGYGMSRNDRTTGTMSETYAPITLVTVAWFLLFYTFLFHQSYTHSCVYVSMVRAVKKDGRKERVSLVDVKRNTYDEMEVQVVNTTVRNTMEQSMTVIPLLWCCAVLGGAHGVAIAKWSGWAWALSRAYYPIAYAQSKAGLNLPVLMLSTLPGYAAQMVMAAHLLSSIVSK